MRFSRVPSTTTCKNAASSFGLAGSSKTSSSHTSDTKSCPGSARFKRNGFAVFDGLHVAGLNPHYALHIGGRNHENLPRRLRQDAFEGG